MSQRSQHYLFGKKADGSLQLCVDILNTLFTLLYGVYLQFCNDVLYPINPVLATLFGSIVCPTDLNIRADDYRRSCHGPYISWMVRVAWLVH